METVQFSGKGIDDNGDLNTPIAGADVILLGSNPPVTTTSDDDGCFLLTQIPANQPFTVKITKTGYADIYTADFTASDDITAPLIFHFLPHSLLSDWGNTAGKGMIIGQVIDAGNGYQPVSGATVTITNSSDGKTYTVVYMDEDSGTFGTAQNTTSEGIFAVLNVTDSTTLTLTASKDGYPAPATCMATAHADAATEVFLSMKSEIDDVKAAFQAGVNAYNTKDLAGFTDFISQNYLNNGETRDDFLTGVQSEWADSDFTTASYTITSSNIDGDIATLNVSWNDGDGDAMIFKKEDGTWRLYGNQLHFEAEAFSGYQANPTPEYWASIRVDDPNDRIDSVDVSGPGITNTISLNHDTNEKAWVTRPTGGTSSDLTPRFGGTRPTLPLSYTVTIHFDSGSQEIQEIAVKEFLDTVSPENTQPADGLDMTPADAENLSFSWDSPGSEYTFGIQLFDQDGNLIWSKWEIDANSIPYEGPALTGGAYHYNLFITDDPGNSSMTTVPFYVIVPGDISGDGNVGLDDAVDALQVLSGMDGAGHVSPAADLNGDGKIGLPDFIILLQKLAGQR